MTKARSWSAGIASCAGMCGELVAGVLPNGEAFHVTLPIEKYSTMEITLRPALSTSVRGIPPKLTKTKSAVEAAIALYAPRPHSAVVQRFSNLEFGKGMASSTADIVAAVRAVADAFEKEATTEEILEIVRRLEPCHGVLYPGIQVVSLESGRIIQKLPWSPRLLVLLIIPSQRLAKRKLRFENREHLAKEYEKILDKTCLAAKKRDLRGFANAALRSAEINQDFFPHPLFSELMKRYDQLGALGFAIAHAGAVAGLLYEDTPENGMRVHQAISELRGIFPTQYRFDFVRTTRAAESKAKKVSG